MASVSVSIDIAVSAENVWPVVGDFDGLPGWLELIRASRLSDGGRVRHLEAVNGSSIVERLLDHSDQNLQYLYTILEGPDPVTDYTASMSLRRIDAHHTTVTWASRFEPNDPNEAESLTAHYRSLYLAGLTRLKAVLETQGR
ncbi:SRPBCC family protein [Paraburkholderia hospita]|uniref:SRPBCC family protein n=1 Tax=Paraburkholderia hospita TaxID=169430 RepID=UPI000B347738|nr:SRPBCC family protein [Paraburkholderia hospita]AXF04697.1 SRPBCC family protein [Paraburkholderia hospita]OUL72923.1 MxaD family protein [Paraburkholderia hospita]